MAAIPHIIFAAVYALYAFTFIKNSVPVIYPVFLAPFVIYGALLLASFSHSKIGKKKFKQSFVVFAPALYAFVLLFAAPMAVKVNFPDPHNFAQRKLELVLGASYALFLFSLAWLFIRAYLAGANTAKINEKTLFTRVALFFFAFYALLALWFNYANEPTGDEPFYLLASHSIIYDRDLDLRNNFENKDYNRFYSRELSGHVIERNGKLLSYHPPLYSLIIAPFYAAGGRLGVSMFSAAVCALNAAFLFLLLLSIFKNKETALLAAAVTGFFLPVAAYSNLISTEMISALLCVATLYFILNKSRFSWLAIVCSALLPWLHMKNLPAWIMLCLIYGFENRGEIKKTGLFFGAQLASLLLFFAFNAATYGAPVPRVDAGTMPTADYFSFSPAGLASLFFDQELGILFYSPVFIFALAGAWQLFKSGKKITAYLLALLVPQLALITFWKYGKGDSRFLIPVFFTLAVFLCAAFTRLKSSAAKKMYRVTIAWSAVMAIAVMMVPWFRWGKGDGNWVFKFVGRALHFDITKLFPSLVVPGAADWLALGIWATFFIALNIMILLQKPQK